MPPRRKAKSGVDVVDSDVPASTTQRSQAKTTQGLRRSTRRRTSVQDIEEKYDDDHQDDEDYDTEHQTQTQRGRSTQKKTKAATTPRRSNRTNKKQLLSESDDEHSTDAADHDDDDDTNIADTKSTTRSTRGRRSTRQQQTQKEQHQEEHTDDNDEDIDTGTSTTRTAKRSQPTKEPKRRGRPPAQRKDDKHIMVDDDHDDDADDTMTTPRRSAKSSRTKHYDTPTSSDIVKLEQKVELCVAHGEVLIETTAHDSQGNQHDMGSITVTATIPNQQQQSDHQTTSQDSSLTQRQQQQQQQPTHYTIHVCKDKHGDTTPTARTPITPTRQHDDRKDHNHVLDSHPSAVDINQIGTVPYDAQQQQQQQQQPGQTRRRSSSTRSRSRTPSRSGVSHTHHKSPGGPISTTHTNGTTDSSASLVAASLSRTASDDAAARHKTRRYRVAYRATKRQCNVCEEPIEPQSLAVEYCNTHTISYNPSSPVWEYAFHCNHHCMKPLHTMLIHDIYGEPAFVEGFTSLLLDDQHRFIELASPNHPTTDDHNQQKAQDTVLNPPSLDTTDNTMNAPTPTTTAPATTGMVGDQTHDDTQQSQQTASTQHIPTIVKPMEYIDADFVVDSCRHTDPRNDYEIVQNYQKELLQHEDFQRQNEEAAAHRRASITDHLPSSPNQQQETPQQPQQNQTQHQNDHYSINPLPISPVTSAAVDTALQQTQEQHKQTHSDSTSHTTHHTTSLSTTGNPEIKLCLAASDLKCIHCEDVIPEGTHTIGILNSELTAENPAYRYRHIDQQHRQCVDFSFAAFVMSFCNQNIEDIEGFHDLPHIYQDYCRERFQSAFQR